MERDSSQFSVDFLTQGLSSARALRRLEEEGPNELPSARPRKFYHFVVEVFREPMVFLLLGCGFIYALLGDRQEAFMLLGFLFIIIAITVFQERKAERALEALRDLSSPRALVLRDGERKRIAGREVVREDIVFVNEGDRVPADGILLAGSNVTADESLLTGESIPVDKNVGAPLYAGTTLVRGHGTMSARATAAQTELGKIGKSIKTAPQAPTQLESQTRRLVWKLSWIAAFLCVLVVLVYGMTRHNWLSGFLAGLSLAMAILPNELPAVLTIFLALGAWRMSQRRVLTRKIPAIENLGATTVLCVDKTGTLTLNRMAIQVLFSAGRYLSLSDQTGAAIPDEFHEVLEFGLLASSKDPFDPMEKAFQAAGGRFLKGTEHLHPEWALTKEYPLTAELLSISHIWKTKGKEEYVVGAKGAPEAIIDLCHLPSQDGSRISNTAHEMASQGLRVIGVAKARLQSPSLPERQHDIEFRFVGLVGLADPIRPGVREAIAECYSAGVRVVMITGDHPDTARSIARQIGLKNPDKVVTGSDLLATADSELNRTIRDLNVFSRTRPEQKLRIVSALKSSGEVVAMTGDGVNDAPALKSADIGIAMGGRGTDVARESASVVLLDDDFSSIVEAIRMGRRTYSNLRNAFVYLLSAHVPIAGISVLPVLLKLPLVLMPVHIAFLHLIIEPVCSVAYEAAPASPDTMRVPPRKTSEPLFSRQAFQPSLIAGGSVLLAVLLIFVVALYRGQGEADARALTFTTLIIANLGLIGLRKTGFSKLYFAIFTGSIVLLLCVLYIPRLREIFKFSTLHPLDLLLCIGIGLLSVILPRALGRAIRKKHDFCTN